MQPEVPEPGTPADWLRHARSDLAVARTPPTGDILRETLCFHAQQAAEKSIKAVLIWQGIPVIRSHNIRTLLELLPSHLPMPDDVDQSAGLTEYAVNSRYPAGLEAVAEEDYQEAVRLAEAVIIWAARLISTEAASRS